MISTELRSQRNLVREARDDGDICPPRRCKGKDGAKGRIAHPSQFWVTVVRSSDGWRTRYTRTEANSRAEHDAAMSAAMCHRGLPASRPSRPDEMVTMVNVTLGFDPESI